MTYVYWRHRKSGDIYAIWVNDDGVFDGVHGPVPPKEATRAKLPKWKFNKAEGVGEAEITAMGFTFITQ